MPEHDSATWSVGERDVRVSNLGKLVWPGDGLTKGDLLDYLRAIAPTMLPHLAGRPLTLRVYPDDINGRSFYQRDLPDDAPAWLSRAAYTPAETGRTIHVPLADEAADLVWLANRGCLELHAWSSREPDLTEPDQAVFDLDPGDETPFEQVLAVGLRLRDVLSGLGLRACAKTSGRSGLHVHVPLAPGHRFEAVRAWVKGVALELAAAAPDEVTEARGATHRGRLVAVDYAQNSIARSMAAAYGVRAVAGAPVSAPLAWDEVAAGRVRPADFTLRTMPERVQAVGDLFAPMLRRDQRLPVDR